MGRRWCRQVAFDIRHAHRSSKMNHWQISQIMFINLDQFSRAHEKTEKSGSIWNPMRRWLIILTRNLLHIEFRGGSSLAGYIPSAEKINDPIRWNENLQSSKLESGSRPPPPCLKPSKAEDNSIKMSPAGGCKPKWINDKAGRSSLAIAFVLCSITCRSGASI